MNLSVNTAISSMQGGRDFELLVACARVHPDGGITARIQEIIREDIDWDHVLEQARKHGVALLLHHNLHPYRKSHVPLDAFRRLSVFRGANTRHVRMLTDELVKLMGDFESAGIRAIPYKGPLIGTTIYGDLSLRSFWDLDVLVDRRDFARATNLLLSLGFRLKEEFFQERSFAKNNNLVEVDLHKGLTTHRWLPLDVGFDELWERRETVALGGGSVVSLSTEDLLWILCMQVAKDGWENNLKLVKLGDIAELLDTCRVDWQDLIERARATGTQGMVSFAFHLVHDFFGSQLPEGVMPNLAAATRIRALAQDVGARLFEDSSSEGSRRMPARHFHFLIRERWRDKLAPYVGPLIGPFVPTDKERALVSLPPSLSFLYCFIRPVRLIVKYMTIGVQRVLGQRGAS